MSRRRPSADGDVHVLREYDAPVRCAASGGRIIAVFGGHGGRHDRAASVPPQVRPPNAARAGARARPPASASRRRPLSATLTAHILPTSIH